MKKYIFFFIAATLFFWTVPSTRADEFVLEYETAFTLRDNDLDGEADEFDDESNGFWGLITNSNSQIDEFLLEFDISNLKAACSAKFEFFFSRSGPSSLPYELKLAVYEADGVASLTDFGGGDFFASVIISNIEENVFLVDLTSVFNSFIASGVSHLGIRLYDPISIISPTIAAQLKFEEGNLTIISAAAKDDKMHPTGAVHAYHNIHWPPIDKRDSIKLNGYVLDELSIAKDGGGIGVSQAFLKVNHRKIILKDESTNLLDENGRFNIKVRLGSKKYNFYHIRLYAADTNPEEPNFGLVDSTIVRMAYSMREKSEDRGNKFEKKNK